MYTGPKIATTGLKLGFDPISKISYSGSGNVYTNMITKTNGTINGTVNHSYNDGGYFSFNANGQGISLNETFGSSGFNTISVWHKRDDGVAGTGWRTLIGHASANIHHLALQSSTKKITVFDGTSRASTYTVPNDGKFHNYTIVYNNGINFQLYVDGIYNTTTAMALDFTANPFGRIGNWNSGNYWAGPVGNVLYWDKELTSVEILNNYKNTLNRYK